ncbi:MAG: PGPGW domain-containing protein [Planctomycetaceae bacterium]
MIGWFAVASLATFVVSAVLLPWLLTRLPADYFDETTPTAHPRWPRHPALYWSWRLLKNLLGVVLLLAGFVMLVTPGQGILTILAGLWLLDLPGKRRWERSIISRPQVLASINWIRKKAGQQPLSLNDYTK